MQQHRDRNFSTPCACATFQAAQNLICARADGPPRFAIAVRVVLAIVPRSRGVRTRTRKENDLTNKANYTNRVQFPSSQKAPHGCNGDERQTQQRNCRA